MTLTALFCGSVLSVLALRLGNRAYGVGGKRVGLAAFHVLLACRLHGNFRPSLDIEDAP
jgi:hypothetical protein